MQTLVKELFRESFNTACLLGSFCHAAPGHSQYVETNTNKFNALNRLLEMLGSALEAAVNY